ncbi:hypothetical protein KI387_020515, partial [Taxus chinensis]
MTDHGEIHYCLGIQISRDREKRKIHLSQESYIRNILKKFGMENCKPVSTPMEVGNKLSLDMCPKTQEEESYMSMVPYQNVVGSLMYAMVSSRPDIAHAVSIVSQYSSNPGPQHWVAVKRIFRYLQGTAKHGIRFNGSSKKSLQLTGYCDADWAGDVDSKRSTSGFYFILGGGAVSWASKKQRSVSLSSAEAEYIAACQVAKKLIWLRRLLQDIEVTQSQPTILKFAILSGPTVPIIGEGDEEANDRYVEQLVASAEAAVDEVVRRGVAHPNKIAIGGHSYGAFMTANLLAHAPHLFCCGVARSGAYNRTLTPFGFQNEERTLWEATCTYVEMSPFMLANKIKKPLLLVHGEEDNNPGTLT